MAVSLLPLKAALKTNITQPFSHVGGTAPFTYSVIPGGAGGTINSSGVYTSPNTTGLDRVKITDATGASYIVDVRVGTAIQLVCDIIQNEMELGDRHVYMWDQKINAPTDEGLFIAVGVISCKPFGNSNTYFEDDDEGLSEKQSINMQALLSIDIISRGTDARDRKEEVIMALRSNYAESQQELNSFSIAILPSSFVNLSQEDGAAIPYRFNISANLQYFVTKTKPIPYYDTYILGDIATDP